MGSNWTPERVIYCSTDCEQMGCPGHKLKIEMNRSVDINTIWVDDEALYYMDDNMISAIIDLYQGPSQ